MQQLTDQSVGQRKDFPGQYLDIALVAGQYKIYWTVMAFDPPMQSVTCYSYITSRSRISLLLHETESETWGRVLITMISYECLWYNCFMSYCFWLQTDHKRFLSILLVLLKINTLKLFIDLLDGLEIQKKPPTLMTFDDLLDGIDINNSV